MFDRRMFPTLSLLAALAAGQEGCGGDVMQVSGDAAPSEAGRVTTPLKSLPCEPRRVLEAVCQQCHSDPPKNGAPFALRDLADITDWRDDRQVSTLMIAVLERRRMPLPPVTITDADRDVLLDWLRAGAPGVSPRICP